MDTIVGPGNKGAILTLTERSTNFILAAKLHVGKNTDSLAKVVWRLLLPYKEHGLKTITTDNGSEFAGHRSISKRLNVPVFLLIRIPPGRKGLLKMRTNLSDSISLKIWTWILFRTGNSLSSTLKSMTDIEKNLTSISLNRVSSIFFANIALVS